MPAKYYGAMAKFVWFMSVTEVLSIIMKVAIASLMVGTTLSYFDITIESMLLKAGFTMEEFQLFISQAIDWMIPNMVMGAFVIVPIWLVVVLLLPPRPPRSS